MNGLLTPADLEDLGEDEAGTRVERQARADASLAGMRADAAAARLFPEFSRSRLAEWIRDGALRFDGRVLRPKDALRGDETATLSVLLVDVDDARPEPIPLVVRYEDADLLVIDKPAGLVVHPGAGNPHGTLVNALLHRDPALRQLPRAGIVHRLDKDTTGLMVVARTLAAHTALVAKLAAREVHRQYLAVVVGECIAGGSVDAPIDRHPRDRLKMAVREDGRHAVTHYRLREQFPGHTALECRLETGRTHQIRVHMAHIGHPIVGDPLYGPGPRPPRGASARLVEALRGFRRQALHAERLGFAHPIDGRPVEVEAPPPADLVALLDALRAERDRAA